ncbi:cyclic nucleotide-binding domain-containing protein [uncultured Maribacter sp.]|uniref:Crp/Fnr family transcriptional regulator n=1 Tax=uncultured Maribacter sp. TaxID=431308 RepID=UPI00260ECC16|nr:cyclic nucleotide-binding domain-containing protein [uncultured Maribacter sp.]
MITYKLQLKNYLNRFVLFTDSEIDLIYKNLTVRVYKKKGFLLEQNSVCDTNFFICEGLVRSFTTDNMGEEKTSQFAIENWWVTSMESFIKERTSFNALQAIEKTTVLCLSKNKLNHLYQEIPKLERCFRIITENMLIAILRKDEIFMKLSSKERYLGFIGSNPTFMQRVPQYMVASYLDITPEYLSELKKTLHK